MRKGIQKWDGQKVAQLSWVRLKWVERMYRTQEEGFVGSQPDGGLVGMVSWLQEREERWRRTWSLDDRESWQEG
jgi:hypothetical protein